MEGEGVPHACLSFGPSSSFEVFVQSSVLFHFNSGLQLRGFWSVLGWPLDKLASKRVPLCRSVLSVGLPLGAKLVLHQDPVLCTFVPRLLGPSLHP
jgi:hypothetical protein